MHQTPSRYTLANATRPEVLAQLVANPYLALSEAELTDDARLTQLAEMAEQKTEELAVPANTDDAKHQEWMFWVVLGQFAEATLYLHSQERMNSRQKAAP